MTTERETQLLGAAAWLCAIRKLASERPSLALVLLETQPEGVCLVKLSKLLPPSDEPASNDVTRLNAEEKRLIAIGKKIAAIKNLRERSRVVDGKGETVSVLGLREAKDLCDKWEDEEVNAGRLARNRSDYQQQPFGAGQPR